MKAYIIRLKNMWIDSNILGKIFLPLFFPIWLLAGFNNAWDSIYDITFEKPDGVHQVDVNHKWKCCKCGWVGKHSESADKTPVINDMYLLVCPNCLNKDEFYAIKD